MGTCLAIVDSTNNNQKNIAIKKTDLEGIKISIQDELQNSSMPYKRFAQGKQKNKTQDNDTSTQISPSHQTFSIKIKSLELFQSEQIESPPIHNFDFRRDQNLRNKNKNSFASMNFSQSQFDNEQFQSVVFPKDYQEQHTQTSNEGEQIVENPYNRISNQQRNMINYGLTEQDNMSINETLSINYPLKLAGIKLKNKSEYSGFCLNGMRQGFGTLRWNDGSFYQGFWRKNKSMGKGKLTFKNGQTYVGEWSRDRMHGYGLYTYPNGQRYDGKWKNNLKDGYGVYTWNNGQKYQGQWKKGFKNGYGQLYFQDGSYFKGQFYKNQIHGSGAYCWKNVKTYKGQWSHNKMNGKGIMTWEEDGRIYNGMFKKDKIEGFGVLTRTDKSRSTGCWKNGRKDGFFNQEDQLGQMQKVEWKMGKKLKRNYQNGQQTMNNFPTNKSIKYFKKMISTKNIKDKNMPSSTNNPDNIQSIKSLKSDAEN